MRWMLAALSLLCTFPWLSGCMLVPFFDDGSNQDVERKMRELDTARQERMQRSGSVTSEEYKAFDRKMGGSEIGGPGTVEEMEARLKAGEQKGGR